MRARALTPSELGILLLSLGRALESFMGLRRGKSCVAFEDMAALDNAARVAVGKYDGALKQGMREGRGGGEDFSDVELGAPDASGTQGQEAARLPRKDFVEWSLRVLNPYCRPPVVLVHRQLRRHLRSQLGSIHLHPRLDAPSQTRHGAPRGVVDGPSPFLSEFAGRRRPRLHGRAPAHAPLAQRAPRRAGFLRCRCRQQLLGPASRSECTHGEISLDGFR